MVIEIGKTYYRPHSGGPLSVRVIDVWDDGAFKVKCSEDDWGCRLMTTEEISERFYLTDYQDALAASAVKKLG